MSSETELKLLTLLNVCAVKRPRELDLPGGYRGTTSASPTLHVSGNNLVTESKKRKRVYFGGVVGPSSSRLLQSTTSEGKARPLHRGKNGNGLDLGTHGNKNGYAADTGDGVDDLVEDDAGSDEDAGDGLTRSGE